MKDIGTSRCRERKRGKETEGNRKEEIKEKATRRNEERRGKEEDKYIPVQFIDNLFYLI